MQTRRLVMIWYVYGQDLIRLVNRIDTFRQHEILGAWSWMSKIITIYRDVKYKSRFAVEFYEYRHRGLSRKITNLRFCTTTSLDKFLPQLAFKSLAFKSRWINFWPQNCFIWTNWGQQNFKRECLEETKFTDLIISNYRWWIPILEIPHILLIAP